VTSIYLVRHGQTQWNLAGRLQGSMDSPLTELGVSQAKAGSEKLKTHHFDAAYCSPRPRAKKTAELLLSGRGITLQEDEQLSEVNLGQLEGQNKHNLSPPLQQAYEAFWQQPDHYQPLDGECLLAAQQRMVQGIEVLARKHQGQQILLVSHAAVIKLAFCHYLSQPLSDLWQPPMIDNGELNQLHWCPDQGMSVRLYNGLSSW